MQLGHSHATVVRHGRNLLVNLAHLCGRCPTAVARIWDGVAELRGPLRAQLARRVAATLQAARGPPGGSPFSPSQPQERLQVEAFLQNSSFPTESRLHQQVDRRRFEVATPAPLLPTAHLPFV